MDEVLARFRGWYTFSNKLWKYGMKVMVLNGVTCYFLNAYIYSAKDNDGTTFSDTEDKLGKLSLTGQIGT